VKKYKSRSKILMRFKILFIILILFSSCAKEVTINKEAVLFEIKRGDTIFTIAKNLQKSKIIKNPKRFQIIAKLTRRDRLIKYGIYQINPQEDYESLLEKFISGKTYSVKITINEGFNIFQIAELLENKGLVKKEEFLSECKNNELTKRYGLPNGATLEGFLFPDTYYIPLNYNSKQIIEIFLNRFDSVVNNEMREKIKEKGLSLLKVIIMASIVEKEAKLEEEKPIIAKVFYNRLKKGMLLQADPTLIYALILNGTYDGNIRKKDFMLDSKYNTYKYYGLPILPICNPGKNSILAAIFPADVDYIYFVAKPDGSHYFSKSLEEHNRAVYIYQILPIKRR